MPRVTKHQHARDSSFIPSEKIFGLGRNKKEWMKQRRVIHFHRGIFRFGLCAAPWHTDKNREFRELNSIIRFIMRMTRGVAYAWSSKQKW